MLVDYEVPYLEPEGCRPDRSTQAVGHTGSGNIGIIKILRYIRSDMYTAKIHHKKNWQEDPPTFPGQQGPVRKHNGKSGTGPQYNCSYSSLHIF